MRNVVKNHFVKHNPDNNDEEREKLYRVLRWKLIKIPIEELGIWDNAHNIPHKWCIENLKETVDHYIKADNHDGEYLSIIQYLVNQPECDKIIVVDGRTGRGRECCQKTKWNIDDGCMRALTYALKGHKYFQCYAGSLSFLFAVKLS